MENITHIYQVKNERMGGFVPSWDAPKSKPEFNNILSSFSPINEPVEISKSTENKKFGFLDIIDIVNPLQHVPLVNMAYRAITGDEIKPVSKVIGAGVFGGAVGAASGLINVIIEQETGKDLIGNALSFAGISKEHKAYEDLPASLLAFAEMPITAPVIEKKDEYERIQIANGRTAGSIAVYS